MVLETYDAVEPSLTVNINTLIQHFEQIRQPSTLVCSNALLQASTLPTHLHALDTKLTIQCNSHSDSPELQWFM